MDCGNTQPTQGSDTSESPGAEQRLRGKRHAATLSSREEASREPEKPRADVAANRQHAEFVTLLTQELRQSLQAMLGFTQLMERDEKEPLPGRHRERVRHVLDAGDHVLRIVDDALALARIEAGQLPVATQPVDILDVIEHVRAALDPAAMSRRIQIAVGSSSATSERPIALADAGSFANILLRLGSNAIENSKPQSRVEFRVSGIGSARFRTNVIDSGAGISLEEQHQLFQPFPRVTRLNGSARGAGLGLVTCKRLVELMHGSIGYRSIPGQGSEFWVELPAHRG